MPNQSMRRWLACGAAAGVLALAAAPALAEAQMAAYSFDQPAQPLADAVQAVGHQTGTNVLVDPRLVGSSQITPIRRPCTQTDATSEVGLMG